MQRRSNMIKKGLNIESGDVGFICFSQLRLDDFESIMQIEEMIKEAEEKEELQTQSYFDLLLIEIGKMQGEITETFEEAEKEAAIIREWGLNKNSKVQTRIEYLERKLEAYIREQKKKTIDLVLFDTIRLVKMQYG